MLHRAGLFSAPLHLCILSTYSSRWPSAPQAGSCHPHLAACGLGCSSASQCSWTSALPAPDEDFSFPASSPVSHEDLLQCTHALFHTTYTCRSLLQPQTCSHQWAIVLLYWKYMNLDTSIWSKEKKAVIRADAQEYQIVGLDQGCPYEKNLLL